MSSLWQDEESLIVSIYMLYKITFKLLLNTCNCDFSIENPTRSGTNNRENRVVMVHTVDPLSTSDCDLQSQCQRHGRDSWDTYKVFCGSWWHKTFPVVEAKDRLWLLQMGISGRNGIYGILREG